MYKTQTVTNIETTNTFIDLLTSTNDINKFQTEYTTIIDMTSKHKTDIKRQKTGNKDYELNRRSCTIIITTSCKVYRES